MVHKALNREQAVHLAANGVLSTCYQVWPDVVFTTSAFFTPSWMMEVIKARGHKTVMLFTESPYQDGQQLEMAQFADVSLLNDPVNIDAYREIGPVAYMPHAYRPAVHHPARPGSPLEHDLAFIGTGFPSRVRFFEAMDLTGLDVQLGGPWLDLPEDSPLRVYTDHDPANCVDNEDTAEIYRRSRCGINFYRREAEDAHVGEGWAVGPREVEMAACGLWFMRDPRPESDSLFPMLPTFTDAGEASELLRWALAHPEDRAEAAGKARAAIGDRTFVNNARKLLAMLNH